MNLTKFLGLSSLLFAVATAAVSQRVTPRTALPSPISENALRAHIKFLSDDRLEGRGTGARGGELAADQAHEALSRGRFRAGDLAAYDRERARAFRGKWLFERLVSGAVALPGVFDRIASRLARRQRLADLMIGVAGDFVPVSRMLRPWNVWRLVL